jgi:hypothetical protein
MPALSMVTFVNSKQTAQVVLDPEREMGSLVVLGEAILTQIVRRGRRVRGRVP